MQPITPSLAFFYNPPGFLVNYHITCEEVPMSFELVYQLTNDTDDNDQTYNYVQSKSYAFYHSQIDSKKIYRITCELASAQFLNKRFYNIDYNQQSLQQHQQQEISPLHFKLHLKQLLTNYLAPKEIYKQNLYRNMMQDNFNEEVMDGTPSFRNASDDYTQDYENSLHLDHFVQKLHVNVVNDYLQKWLVRSTSKLLN
ncbi:kinase-like domain-containing protein [Rhizophagus irregularis DAOM 181602=DAOM 197198]|nr:kinase-like domain-containing protein [Rhizophagus irregularis DAOM 181602=DAOM 197198]